MYARVFARDETRRNPSNTLCAPKPSLLTCWLLKYWNCTTHEPQHVPRAKHELYMWCSGHAQCKYHLNMYMAIWFAIAAVCLQRLCCCLYAYPAERAARHLLQLLNVAFAHTHMLNHVSSTDLYVVWDEAHHKALYCSVYIYIYICIIWGSCFNSRHTGPRRAWKGGCEQQLMTPDPGILGMSTKSCKFRDFYNTWWLEWRSGVMFFWLIMDLIKNTHFWELFWRMPCQTYYQK